MELAKMNYEAWAVEKRQSLAEKDRQLAAAQARCEMLKAENNRLCVEGHEYRAIAENANAALAKENATLKGLLRESILDIMERREYSVCWHDGSDFDGDCGNWPECNPECSLRKLMDAVGIKPQVDGGVDKQEEPAPETGGEGQVQG